MQKARMPSWQLADADEIAAASKYTFYKPSREIIGRVAPRQHVKIIFRFVSDDPDAPAAERMWVIVDAGDGQGGFRGRLDNVPKFIRDLKIGDTLEFASPHIINTEHDETDNLVERYLTRCFVTRRVLDEGRRVGYLYREEP